jgi:hypothetical protein
MKRISKCRALIARLRCSDEVLLFNSLGVRKAMAAATPSSFQNSFGAFFEQLSRETGVDVKLEQEGVREIIHKYTLPVIASKIWIYDDGANFTNSSEDIRYEVCDFDTLDEMENAIKADIRRRLTI